MREVKVLYVLGYPRSGSTILGNLLGEMDGFFHAGEVCYLWRNALNGAPRCGCQRVILACEVWSPILQRLGGASRLPATASRWRSAATRACHVPRVLRQQPGVVTGWRPLDQYRRVLASLYRAISQVTGARVIVDSSKYPADGAIVGLLRGTGVDPYFVHLVRDLRGVVFSRQRKLMKREPGRPARMQKPWLVYDALGWTGVNVAAEAVCRRLGAGRSLRVPYEEFASDPNQTLTRLAEAVGEPNGRLPFDEIQRAHLGVNHTVGGNRNRFESGAVEIRPDTRWVGGMSSFDRRLVTLLTAPSLRRYGYVLGVHSSRKRL